MATRSLKKIKAVKNAKVNPGSCDGCAHQITSNNEETNPCCEAEHDFEVAENIGCKDYK